MTPPRWWGSWSFRDGEARRWEVGPLRLLVERRPREWRLAHEESGDPLDPGGDVAVTTSADALDETEQRLRVPTENGGGVRVAARLADRNMVYRPEVGLAVLPGDRVELYVSSPVWVEVSEEAQGRVLTELPSYRPSDTWLGTTPVRGELCYASRTHCRLHLDELPIRPHRAVTAVRVSNHSDHSLRLDRMSVPLPNLSLYADEQDRLWTASVELTREADDDDLASLHIDPEPPAGSRPEPLAAPRREPEAGGLVRAFAGLF